jgi:hypothetical protein
VSLGLVFLTKAELFAPPAAALAVGVALAATAAVRSGSGVAHAARAPALLVAGMLVPPVICFGALASIMPPAVAARGIAGNWGRLGAGIFDNPFYRSGLGLDDVAGNLGAIAWVTAAVVALVAVAAGIDMLLTRAIGTSRLVAPALALAATLALIAAGAAIPWHLVGRALAPAAGLGALAAVALALRARTPAEVARVALLPIWSVFAFLLLGKMLLAARIWHYGFTLALPATLLLVAGLVWLVPALVRARGGDGGFARALLLGPIAACAAFFFSWSSYQYARKDFAVASGADTFFAENSAYDPRAGVIAAAAAELQTLMPADATLLVLPEGTMLNWLLRRSSPSRYTLFVPPSIAFAGGEERMLEDLRAHPPDFIALLHRETAEYGAGYFGADPHYGRAIRDWVLRDYTRVGRIGAEPFEGPRFGVALLRRNSSDGPARSARGAR